MGFGGGIFWVGAVELNNFHWWLKANGDNLGWEKLGGGNFWVGEGRWTFL